MALNQPKSKHHKDHGVPEPSTGVSETDRMRALDLMKEPEKVFIYYVRKKPEVAVNRDEEGNHRGYKLVRSAPIGALVAFQNKEKPKDITVGWSRRNSSVTEKTVIGKKDGKKRVKVIGIEPLPFTKRDAVYVAILRGLTDSVQLRVSKKNAKTSEGVHIPKDVVRQLPRFAERIEPYFGSDCKIKNVSFGQED